MLLSIVVKHTDYVTKNQRWRSPPDATGSGIELHNLDGTDEHDEDILIDVWLSRWRDIPRDLVRFFISTFTPLFRLPGSFVTWVIRSFHEYWRCKWETLAILLQTVLLGLVTWMTYYFAHRCVIDAEQNSSTFGGIRQLGVVTFPALEILAFLPTYRDAWHGEASQVIRESYLSAT